MIVTKADALAEMGRLAQRMERLEEIIKIKNEMIKTLTKKKEELLGECYQMLTTAIYVRDEWKDDLEDLVRRVREARGEKK